jgi:hypothetical protein
LVKSHDLVKYNLISEKQKYTSYCEPYRRRDTPDCVATTSVRAGAEKVKFAKGGAFVDSAQYRTSTENAGGQRADAGQLRGAAVHVGRADVADAQMLRGDKLPSLIMAFRMAQILGVPLTELFYDTEERSGSVTR